MTDPGATQYYVCPNGHPVNWNIGDPVTCPTCGAALVVEVGK